ncbi:hypothetical protein SELMODRAFT_402908 [Selaginella moellendorffii]|uniref:Uncharacterized protein n=1 Tax=Selaginella moellendorffii TaxID=88036 RepID=D8QNF0_SELML|nr:hypothetical protein SELMODRAFT_402908 [Selaginella moellendorffii]
MASSSERARRYGRFEVEDDDFRDARSALGRLYLKTDEESFLSSVTTITTVVMVDPRRCFVPLPALSGYDPFRCKWAVLFPTDPARMSATFVAVDEEHEIAMLQIEKDMPFLPVSTELMKLGRRYHFLAYLPEVDQQYYAQRDATDEEDKVYPLKEF